MVSGAGNIGRTLQDLTIPTSQRTTGAQLGQQDFLKIMIEQLKGQNPLDSQDSNQFFAQMVQFQTLDAMSAMQNAIDHLSQVSGLASATSLVGKTVTASVPQPNDPTTGFPVRDRLTSGVVRSVTIGSAGAVLNLDRNVSVPASKVTRVS